MANYLPRCKSRHKRISRPTDPNSFTASSFSTEAPFSGRGNNVNDSSLNGVPTLVPESLQPPEVICMGRAQSYLGCSTLSNFNYADLLADNLLQNSLQSNAHPNVWSTVAFLTDKIVVSSSPSNLQPHRLPSFVENSFLSSFDEGVNYEFETYTAAENFLYPLSHPFVSVQGHQLLPPLKKVCLQGLLYSFCSASSFFPTHLTYKAVESYHTQRAVEALAFEPPQKILLGNLVKNIVPVFWPVPIGSIVPSGALISTFHGQNYHIQRSICRISFLPRRNKLEVYVQSNGSCKITIRTITDELRPTKRRLRIHRARFGVGERVSARPPVERYHSLGVSTEYPRYLKLKPVFQNVLRVTAVSVDLTTEIPPSLKVSAVTIFTAYEYSWRFLEWLAVTDIDSMDGRLGKPFSFPVRLLEKSVPQLLSNLQSPVSFPSESQKMKTIFCPLDGLDQMDSCALRHRVLRNKAAKGCRRHKFKVKLAYKSLPVYTFTGLQAGLLATVSPISDISVSSAEVSNKTVLPNHVSDVERNLQGPVCRHLAHKFRPAKDRRSAFLFENLCPKSPVDDMELKKQPSSLLASLASFPRDSTVSTTSDGSSTSSAIRSASSASITRRRCKFSFMDPLIQPPHKTEVQLLEDSNQSSSSVSSSSQDLMASAEFSTPLIKNTDTPLNSSLQYAVSTVSVASDIQCACCCPFLGGKSNAYLATQLQQQELNERNLEKETFKPEFEAEAIYCGSSGKPRKIITAGTNFSTRTTSCKEQRLPETQKTERTSTNPPLPISAQNRLSLNQTSEHPTGFFEPPSRGQVVLAYVDFPPDDTLMVGDGGGPELGSHSSLTSPILIPELRKSAQFF